jgi:hypothetical protein
MKTVLVIVEVDCTDGDKSVIGVASDRASALAMIREYYGADALQSELKDYREDGIDFTLTMEVDFWKCKVVVRYFDIDRL